MFERLSGSRALKHFLYHLYMLIALLGLIFGVRQAYSNDVIRVAIVDTGLDLNDPRFKPLLCEGVQHKDFTGEGLKDVIGHGTHIAGLIKQYAAHDKAYCFIIVKFFSYSDHSPDSAKKLFASLRYAISQHADIVNLSLYGSQFFMEEYLILKSAEHTTFVACSGNSGLNIDFPTNEAYPASYVLNNIVAVGALNEKGTDRYTSSNFGKTVKAWEIGENVMSTLPDGVCGTKPQVPYECEGPMSGTSMATAIHTGKLVKQLIDNKCQSKGSNGCKYDHSDKRL